MDADLVVVSLGGVQRFITESRTTGDVAGASEAIQDVVRHAARTARDRLASAAGGLGVVFPALGDGSAPDAVSNKIVFLAPAGGGPKIARAVAAEVNSRWDELVRAAYSAPVPATPGMPDVAWVSVTGPAGEAGYPELWSRVQAAMAARRRGRVFAPLFDSRMSLCAVAPHLPASRVPAWARSHERSESLSAAGWTKRRVARTRLPGFPSTAAIASRMFRARLARVAPSGLDAAVAELAEAVRKTGATDVPAELGDALGEWVYPDRWQAVAESPEYTKALGSSAREVAGAGRDAARRLVRLAEDAEVEALTPYYAVVVQDVDRLGRALGTLSMSDQRVVSRQLTELAAEQRGLAEGAPVHAVPVYAGGDDFLAFCPAATALELAGTVRALVDQRLATGPLGQITASSAVVFAHLSSALQEAIGAARDALEAAKSTPGPGGEGRDALAVVALRRGGERARTIQPWRPAHTGPGMTATTVLAAVRPARDSGELSAGLATRLERDRAALAELAARPPMWPTLQAELARLVERQGGSAAAAGALWTLGMNERSGGDGVFRAGPAALVARFLTQECR